MPDRWLALGYVGGARAFVYAGTPIRATRSSSVHRRTRPPASTPYPRRRPRHRLARRLQRRRGDRDGSAHPVRAAGRLQARSAAGRRRKRGSLTADEGAGAPDGALRGAPLHATGSASSPQARRPTTRRTPRPASTRSTPATRRARAPPPRPSPPATARTGTYLARALGIDDSCFTRVPAPNRRSNATPTT